MIGRGPDPRQRHFRHFYYYFDYRAKYPSMPLRLMFIANRLVHSYLNTSSFSMNMDMNFVNILTKTSHAGCQL